MAGRVYNWMVEAASKESALWILAAISFIESSFFPIPPDIMLIPMVVAIPQKAWKIASVATIASVVGGYFGLGLRSGKNGQKRLDQTGSNGN